MVRIYGVQLPQNKRIVYALRYVYGIGLHRAQAIISAARINEATRVQDLTREEEAAIVREISTGSYMIEGDLRKYEAQNIQRLERIKCYRGDRHKRGLPVNGGRTKTNARTRKGPRTAGSAIALKRKISKK